MLFFPFSGEANDKVGTAAETLLTEWTIVKKIIFVLLFSRTAASLYRCIGIGEIFSLSSDRLLFFFLYLCVLLFGRFVYICTGRHTCDSLDVVYWCFSTFQCATKMCKRNLFFPQEKLKTGSRLMSEMSKKRKSRWAHLKNKSIFN